MNQGHVQSGEVINLQILKEDMHIDASYALVKTGNMEVIRMALPEGKKIGEHDGEGEVSVQCMKGNIHFIMGDATCDLTKRDWLYLQRKQPFSYHVKTDTILLVTISFTKNA